MFEPETTHKLLKPTTSYKWVKYNGRLTVCIKENQVWEKYLRMCEKHKYTNYPYDKIFNYITCKESGITRIERHRAKCIKIDKLDCEK